MPSIPQKEQEILDFWTKENIFEKSVNKTAPRGDFVFFDGPPFATGTPHYGHIVASLMKDAVPRYFTMRGYRVERRWGWDCHGLPIENIVEDELKSASKKELEEKVGVAAFNEKCRGKVLMYADEWKKFIPRMGRWVDMGNPYKTMDPEYMESVWWAFKELWNKGLIYEGHKAMHICPRCETTLSQSEVSQGYKDISDVSVVVKFPLKDDPNTIVLAWTTTPWTLPGNAALVVGKDITYVMVSLSNHGDKNYILAKDTLEKILPPPSPPFQGGEKGEVRYKVIEEIKGSELVGKSYEPLFPYFTSPQPSGEFVGEGLVPSRIPGRPQGSPLQDINQNVFKIYPADFVSTTEGTGIVHIAPAFGQDDLNLGTQYGLPFLQHVDFSGRFTPEVKDFAGMQVKPSENPKACDAAVVAWLEHHGKLFSQAEYTHSYPHCWRCDTPLLNYATSSWFVNVTKIKPRLLELAKNISWMPEHIKEGRFGHWLEGAQDWSISRQRFWGSVIPIWKCDVCKKIIVVGSQQELKELSGRDINDLHKHIVDLIEFPCDRVRPCAEAGSDPVKGCSGTMRRIPDVLDCWFESAAMPYAQVHYPFKNKEKFEENFPADFIAEGVDQTRCWFYYMLVLSCAIMDKEPFRNVIANGIVLAEDGQKMSKRLKNYPDPNAEIDKYGADALRYYLLTSPVMKAENLLFSEKGVEEVYKKVILILSNVLSFYKLYAGQEQKNNPSFTSPYNKGRQGGVNPLDTWLVSRLHELIAIVTKNMDAYDLVEASRPIAGFIDDLSTWYIRRSRDRFKSGDPSALLTTHYSLLTLSQVMAPFMPFMAEWIWREVQNGSNSPTPPLMIRGGQGGVMSVHLTDWPQADEKLIDANLEKQMTLVRKICELGHALREETGIKVRQPLSELRIAPSPQTLSLKGRGQPARIATRSIAGGGEGELFQIIQDELNVKKISIGPPSSDQSGWISKTDGSLSVALFTKLNDELKIEGMVRDLVRAINGMRKDAGLTIKDTIIITIETTAEATQKSLGRFKSDILSQTLAKNILWSKVEGEKVKRVEDISIAIQKI